jgi:Uma2 family endonuclease
MEDKTSGGMALSILEYEIRTRSVGDLTDLHLFRFNRDQYHALADLGAFEGRRVELIEGEILEMPPIGSEHAAVNMPVADLLKVAFGQGYVIRTQVPIDLGDDSQPSEPEPDVAVAVGHWRDYTNHMPKAKDLRLIVELAQSSLRDDRRVKAPLYGSAGIPEYWLLNLVDRQLEVYRNPTEIGYDSSTIYSAGESVEPLHAPGQTIQIADMLP